MWTRFTKWCYPNVGDELPRSLHRERADLRPLGLLLVIGFWIWLFWFMFSLI